MFLATAFDPGSMSWTRDGPSGPQMTRIKAAAAHTSTALSALLDSPIVRSEQPKKRTLTELGTSSQDTWLRLFSCPLQPFDAVMFLKRDALPEESLPPAGIHAPLPSARSAIHDLLPDLSRVKAKSAKSARAVLRSIP